MNKILLIEDRVERQEKFTQDTGINLKDYDDILDNKISLEKVGLKEYSTIIVHRSAFGEIDENILDFLKEHCQETGTKLVFFSGGISSTFYSKIKYEFLLLNSKSFYSQNLKLFLDDMQSNDVEANLLLLGYGKNWEINIALNTLAKINLFLSSNISEEKVKLNFFKTQTKIDNIEKIIEFTYPEALRGRVLLNDLKELANDITSDIQRKVELYA